MTIPYQDLGEEQRQKTSHWSTGGIVGVCVVVCAASFGLGRVSVHESSATTKLVETDSSNSSNGTAHLWKPRMLPVYRDEPLAKNIIRRFDLYLMNGATFDTGEFKARNVAQWLADDFKYDTVGFPSSDTLLGWCLGGEESQYRTAFPTSAFTQMLFFGDDMHSTTTSYGIAHFVGDLFGIKAPKVWTYFRVTDFYHVRKFSETEGKVDYNFMMMDFADLFRRIGRPVLPKASLPEGLVLPPSTNDGVPTPVSVRVKDRDSSKPKAAAAGALADGWVGEGLPDLWWHSDLTFYGCGGIGVARGADEYHQHVIQPFRDAFANRTLESRMLFCEANYCAAYGVLHGRHVGTWVGQAASNSMIGVRYAMHFRIVDGKIQEGWTMFDFPGFFAQLGLDFFAIAADMTPQALDSYSHDFLERV